MAVYASLEYLDIKEACIRCVIDSAIPEKRGMGSSAAISIAAIRAVFDYYQADLLHHVTRNLGQSGGDDCSYESEWSGCQDLSQ